MSNRSRSRRTDNSISKEHENSSTGIATRGKVVDESGRPLETGDNPPSRGSFHTATAWQALFLCNPAVCRIIARQFDRLGLRSFLLREASSNHFRYRNPLNSKMQADSSVVSINLRTANFPLGNRKDTLARAAKLDSAGEHEFGPVFYHNSQSRRSLAVTCGGQRGARALCVLACCPLLSLSNDRPGRTLRRALQRHVARKKCHAASALFRPAMPLYAICDQEGF